MTPTELRATCERAQQLAGREDADVPLQVRAGTRGDRKTRRLFGTHGPVGRIVGWGVGSKGRDIVFFPADKVLAWLDKEMQTQREIAGGGNAAE